jgi:addiction module HigA family antidote
MKKEKTFINPFHPGEILLEEFLIPMNTTQVAFAKKIGWTTAKLNELINGKRGITASSAIALSKALNTSAKLWMNLQATWDLNKEYKKSA